MVRIKPGTVNNGIINSSYPIIRPFIRVITPFITSRGPPCVDNGINQYYQPKTGFLRRISGCHQLRYASVSFVSGSTLRNFQPSQCFNVPFISGGGRRLGWGGHLFQDVPHDSPLWSRTRKASIVGASNQTTPSPGFRFHKSFPICEPFHTIVPLTHWKFHIEHSALKTFVGCVGVPLLFPFVSYLPKSKGGWSNGGVSK